VNTGWFAVCCAQLEPAAMAPEIPHTRATPCRKGTRRFVIALPLAKFLIGGRRTVHRAAHPLWADRHNISLWSVREGWRRYLAPGVILLSWGAISYSRPGLCVGTALNVTF